MRATINKVNLALARAGIQGELVRGRGYFYFWGSDEFIQLRSSSVMVSHLTDFTVEEWVAEAQRLLSDPLNQ